MGALLSSSQSSGVTPPRAQTDVHCIERKLDFSVHGRAQHAGRKQRMHVTVYLFHVPLSPARSLTKCHRAAASHGLEQLPPFGGQYFPEQVGRCKGDVRTAAPARKRIDGSLLDGLSIGNGKRHGFQFSILDIVPEIIVPTPPVLRKKIGLALPLG